MPRTSVGDKRLVSFRAFIKAAEAGAPIPPVTADDLKRLHQLCIDVTKRYSGKDGAPSLELIARACRPDADLPAVWVRHIQLRSLLRQGLLADWEHGNSLDDAVYHAAATVPMSGIQIDEKAFVRFLREAA